MPINNSSSQVRACSISHDFRLMLTRAVEVEAERSHLNVKDLQDATGSMFKIFTARQRADKLNEERLRKDLEAREMRDQAKALKLQGPKRAQQGLGTPMSQQTLGGGINAEHRKKFVLEEEDEEQEERMDQKTQELSDLIRGVRQDAEQIGGVLDEQNVLIDSLGNKVWDSLTALKEKNANTVHRQLGCMTIC